MNPFFFIFIIILINNNHASPCIGIPYRKQTPPPFVYHFLDDFPQSASFDVLCDEVESLVFVEDSDELEHIGVIQASHDFHLKDTNDYLFSHTVVTSLGKVHGSCKGS